MLDKGWEEYEHHLESHVRSVWDRQSNFWIRP